MFGVSGGCSKWFLSCRGSDLEEYDCGGDVRTHSGGGDLGCGCWFCGVRGSLVELDCAIFQYLRVVGYG